MHTPLKAVHAFFKLNPKVPALETGTVDEAAVAAAPLNTSGPPQGKQAQVK